MKLVVAIFRAEKLQVVQAALKKQHVDQVTVSNVMGSGHERGRKLIYRSTTVEESLFPKLRLEVALEDACVGEAIRAIQTHAVTGEKGDGVVFVMPLENFVHIHEVDRENRPFGGTRSPIGERLRSLAFTTNSRIRQKNGCPGQ
jgi:nitrogen regulatory protein P-II 1